MSGSNVLMVGGGSWGLALAHLVASNGNRVFTYIRDEAVAMEVNTKNTNSKNLHGFSLSPSLNAFTTFSQIFNYISDIETAFIAIPTSAFTDFFTISNIHSLLNIKRFVICSKGFIQKKDGSFVSPVDFIKHHFAGAEVLALSGPNFAVELMQQKSTITSLASDKELDFKIVKSLLAAPFFSVQKCSDPRAIILLGLCKNPIAIGCGLVDGHTGSSNTKAKFITKITAETTELLKAFSCNPAEFFTSAGIGDVFLSCSDAKSRNFSHGFNFASSQKQDSNFSDSPFKAKTTEGLQSLKAIKFTINQRQLNLPIYLALANCLEGNISVADFVLSI